MRQADYVGQTEPRIKQAKVPLVSPVPSVSGAKVKWSDKPTMQGQKKDPKRCRSKSTEVQVFDTGSPDQLKAYNEILNRAQDPESNLLVIERDQQFVQATANWKIMVRLVYLEFLVILDHTKPAG